MSELKKMTRMGSDVRKLAALLQAKAPKGEMLAYINPREVAILKAHGGKGEPHEDTGIPSFDDGMDLGSFQDIAAADQVAAAPEAPTPQPQISGSPAPTAAPYYSSGSAGTDIQLSSQPQVLPPSELPQPVPFGQVPSELRDLKTPSFVQTPTQEPGVADKLSQATGMSKDTLARLGLAGGLGLLGARTAGRAQQAGRAGAQQMQTLAQPYQQAGQAAQAAAQRGELLPVGQQSLQAAQAQMAQDITRRGGVGAQQATAQIEALRQQLLQQQYDYGLKLSGIGDNIALGAIRTGMQADQYVNQLTNSFYSNMAYIASGMSPGVRVGGTTQGAIA